MYVSMPTTCASLATSYMYEVGNMEKKNIAGNTFWDIPKLQKAIPIGKKWSLVCGHSAA